MIDLQNDFCANGALAVNDGDSIVRPINQLMGNFDTVILTQDWHPVDHKSFSSQHPKTTPFQTIAFNYGEQVLWPDHCIQGTRGANFHPELDINQAHLIVRKGFNPNVDSYSAFFENDKITSTGLHGYLQNRGILDLTMVGLATDFCVAYSALDAAKLGYSVTVRLDMARSIDTDGSLNAAIVKMSTAGVNLENG